MTEITVFFENGWDRQFTDEPDRLFFTKLEDGHLRVMEKLRLIPGGHDNWKRERTLHIYPPGLWREVAFDYEH